LIKGIDDGLALEVTTIVVDVAMVGEGVQGRTGWELVSPQDCSRMRAREY
jgi:hypothetical protein